MEILESYKEEIKAANIAEFAPEMFAILERMTNGVLLTPEEGKELRMRIYQIIAKAEATNA